MDPEVVRELEDQLRSLNSTLGNYNNGVGALANLQDKNITQQQASTNAEQAKKKALDQATVAISSFTSSALHTEDSFKKYNNSVTSLGNMAGTLAGQFGILGKGIEGVIKVLTFFASRSLDVVDSLVQFRDQTVKFTGVLPKSLEEMENFANEAKFSADKIQILQRHITSLGTNLIGLGGIAGKGVGNFLELSNVTEEVRRRFGKLGVNQEELNKMQERYVSLQAASGRAYQLQTKTIDQLREESLAFAENMMRLSSLTGKSADQLQQEQMAAAYQYEEQVRAHRERIQIRDLETKAAQLQGTEEGKRLQKQADLLKIESENRLKASAELRQKFGEQLGSRLGAMLVHGIYNDFTKPVAFIGIELQKYKDQISKATSDTEFREVMARMSDDIRAGTDRNIESFGSALELIGEKLGSNVAIYKDTLEHIGRLGNVLSSEQEKEIDRLTDIRLKQIGWEDETEKRRTQEREIQQKLQEMYSNLASTVLPAVTGALSVFNWGLNKANEVWKFFFGENEETPQQVRETGRIWKPSNIREPIENIQTAKVDEKTAIPIEIENALAAIKMTEGGSYHKKTNIQGSTASGAYQFIDKTWQSLTKKFGVGNEYVRAMDAPSNVQDLIAGMYVLDILSRNNNDVSKIPLEWYTGSSSGKMTATQLAANNNKGSDVYQKEWLTNYENIIKGKELINNSDMISEKLVNKTTPEPSKIEPKQTDNEKASMSVMSEISKKLDVLISSSYETNNINKKILQETRN